MEAKKSSPRKGKEPIKVASVKAAPVKPTPVKAAPVKQGKFVQQILKLKKQLIK